MVGGKSKMTTIEQVRKHMDILRKEIECAGEELRNKQMPEITEELYSLYEKTGNRLTFEHVYFPRRKYLVTFALLSLWYQRPEDIEKLIEVIEEICKEICWALPAHVERNQIGWEKTVDLFSCETGQALAEILFLLSDRLPEKVKRQIKTEVISRVLNPYLEAETGSIRWEHFYNNWVAVCAGSLGSMAIYLLNEEPERQKACLKKVCDILPTYLEGMLEDGTCPEGLSYFTYGMIYYTGFAEQLYEFSGHTIDLMKDKKIQEVAKFQQKCYFDGGITVSFSDGSQKDKYRLGLSCYLADKIPGVVLPPISSAMHYDDDSCYRFMANYRDYLWAEQYCKKREEKERKKEEIEREQKEIESFFVLPNAQWVVGRGAKGSGFAVKGGNNGEPHNHNDVGSFIYTAFGEVFLADLGCGEYNKDYFGKKRYEILCNRSFGHSVPIINKQEQKEGSKFRADSFHSFKKNTAELSFANAYESGIIKEIKRNLVFEEETGILHLWDSFFMAEQTTEIRENLITQIKPEIKENKIILSGVYGSITITILGEYSELQSRQQVFMNHSGIAEDVWQIQWNVIKTSSENAVSKILITPN